MPQSLTFAVPDERAIPLHPVAPEELEDWLVTLPEAQRAWVTAQGFRARLGQAVAIPDGAGGIAAAAVGRGDPVARGRTRFGLARAATSLPAGTYALSAALPDDEAAEAALGWLLTGYRFERYRSSAEAQAAAGRARLVAPAGVDAAAVESLAAAEALTRDLINTPASDLGPAELQAAVEALAAEFSARCNTIEGEALLEAGLPLVHTVGRASCRAPRLIDLRWGDAGPRLTLVGKGVVFDTGGLNLKPGGSMALMKKDMGGAATAIGLARLIMAAGWPVRLRLLIPAVENAVSGSAFRPGDILTSRKGLTVEVNNTDAEGRLVLADALALGAEETPDLMVSFATLTGAARVALGPDLPAFFSDDEGLAATVVEAGARLRDPLWRLPFWPGYEAMIEPGIADLDNAPSGGMAGAITAALFLRRFAEGAGAYAHLDLYGWSTKDAPGVPKGGQGQGARALFGALPTHLGVA
ncbi:MAG: leucyl aminopeptidase family protein [Alkalilacustris sp.]